MTEGASRAFCIRSALYDRRVYAHMRPAEAHAQCYWQQFCYARRALWLFVVTRTMGADLHHGAHQKFLGWSTWSLCKALATAKTRFCEMSYVKSAFSNSRKRIRAAMREIFLLGGSSPR